MSEIEKMYENANIKICERKQGFTLKDCTDRDCKECGYYNMSPFTAEKQIELIKLLSYYYNITISKNFENDYKFQCEGDDVRPYVFASGQDFAQQLAVLINMCSEYLPEEEKAEIKRILE